MLPWNLGIHFQRFRLSFPPADHLLSVWPPPQLRGEGMASEKRERNRPNETKGRREGTGNGIGGAMG